MKTLYPLHGIVTVLNTPFTRHNEIDLPALRRNVENAIAVGVAGFLVPAMASEVYKLSRSERRQMVEAVIDQAAGRAVVIGGAGEIDAGQRREIVRDLIDVDCKNVLLQIPFATREQFRREFDEIAAMDVDMIMLQDWDANGYGIPVDFICDLFARVEKFRCWTAQYLRRLGSDADDRGARPRCACLYAHRHARYLRCHLQALHVGSEK